MPLITPRALTEDAFIAHAATDGEVIHLPFFQTPISGSWLQWVVLPSEMNIVKTFTRPAHVWQMLSSRVSQYTEAAMGEASFALRCQRSGQAVRRSLACPVEFIIEYDSQQNPYTYYGNGHVAMFWKWGEGQDNADPLSPGTYTFGAEVMGSPGGFLWDHPEWQDWISDLTHSILIFKA